MRVIRNTGQNVSPSDDGRLFDQAFTDGMFNSPSINSLGANLVSIGAMYGILCGRDFTADAQNVSVILPESDTATGYIYIRFDTATADIITVESALAPFTPTYEDINTSGTIAEMIIATYTASAVAVTSLTASYKAATPQASAENVTYNSTNVADELDDINSAVTALNDSLSTFIKTTEVTATIPANSQYVSANSPVAVDKVISVMLMYTDAVYYAPPIISCRSSDNTIHVKLTSATTTARAYTIRLIYHL